MRLGLAGVVTAALLAAVAERAAAEDIPHCMVLPPVEEVDPGGLPPALRLAVSRDIGGPFVPPGQPFDATDVVSTGISRRLIWVRRRGTRWVIAFEQGGRAYHDTVLSYEVGYDNQVAGIRAEIAFPSTVCQMTERALWR